MKTEILTAMRKYFGSDQKRINHAEAVLAEAEKLMVEQEVDPEIVVAAAILHDIGIHEAERKHGSTAAKYQQLEGPAVAEKILIQVDFPQKKLVQVLEMIAHHHQPGAINGNEFRILLEADRIVNLKEERG